LHIVFQNTKESILSILSGVAYGYGDGDDDCTFFGLHEFGLTLVFCCLGLGLD
jgi:hypothetical protein